MSEYIEREAAVKAAQDGADEWDGGYNCNRDMYIEAAIDEVPAADVKPVVHSKWKPRDLTWGRSCYYCTNCWETVDMPTTMGVPMFRFCPNCGAKQEVE